MAANQRDRIRDLEQKLVDNKHSETGIYLIELLKAEQQRLAAALIDAENPLLRGQAQLVRHYLKILGVTSLIFE